MKATKGNKEYTITATEKKAYQDRGFDIVDDEGKVIAYGRGKTVPYSDYAQLKEENEVLRTRAAELVALSEGSEQDSCDGEETEAKEGKAAKKVNAKKAGE